MKDRLQQKHTPYTPVERKNNVLVPIAILILLSIAIFSLIWVSYPQSTLSYQSEIVNENSIPTELDYKETQLLEANISLSTFANTPLNYSDIIKKLRKETTTTAQVHIIPSKEVETFIESDIAKIPPKETVQKVFKNNYFVQVGAINDKPDKEFLTKMKKYNFKFLLKSSDTDKNYKKILIGPYHDRVNARMSLVKIRKVINKSAFIVKF